jgi:hypothetical protein
MARKIFALSKAADGSRQLGSAQIFAPARIGTMKITRGARRSFAKATERR